MTLHACVLGSGMEESLPAAWLPPGGPDFKVLLVINAQHFLERIYSNSPKTQFVIFLADEIPVNQSQVSFHRKLQRTKRARKGSFTSRREKKEPGNEVAIHCGGELPNKPPGKRTMGVGGGGRKGATMTLQSGTSNDSHRGGRGGKGGGGGGPNQALCRRAQCRCHGYCVAVVPWV